MAHATKSSSFSKSTLDLRLPTSLALPERIMPVLLPVELIEHTISFLHDDFAGLASCSLLCHGLLPISLSLLWSDITLPVLSPHASAEQPGRQSQFLDIIDRNPTISLYIRSVTLEWPRRAGVSPDWDTVDIWDRFLKGIRVLTFRRMTFRTFDRLFALCHKLSVETLILDRPKCVLSSRIAPVADTLGMNSPHLCPRPTALQRLEITRGTLNAASAAEIAEALIDAGMHASLQEVALRWDNLQIDTSGGDIAKLASWARAFAAIGCSLRRCQLSISWGHPEREIRPFYDLLRPCAGLRALSVHTHLTQAVVSAPQAGTGRLFAFIDVLSELIQKPCHPSSESVSRFPMLEALSLHWSRPILSTAPLPGCVEACARLAAALLHDRAGCPVLRRVGISVGLGTLRYGDGCVSVAEEEVVEEAIRLECEALREGMALLGQASGVHLCIEVAAERGSH